MSINDTIHSETVGRIIAHDDMLDLIKAMRKDITLHADVMTAGEQAAMLAVADRIAAIIAEHKAALKASIDKLMP